MSNIAEFATKVKEMLGKAGYETDVVNGFKVNKELTGLSIKENNNNRETGLTVYLDAYYAKYICGNLTILETFYSVVENLETYFSNRKNNLDSMKNAIVERINSYQYAKKVIFAQLINTSLNKKFLSTLPHREIEDLSVVYYICSEPGSGLSLVYISNVLMEKWGISEEDLWTASIANMASFITFTPMSEILQKFGKEIHTDESFVNDEMLKSSLPIYILSNTWKVNGASQIILFDKVAELLKQHGMTEVYLLPSSLHEWIIVPTGESLYLKELVKSVNEEALLLTDYLSDSIYKFNTNTKKFYRIS